MALVDLPFDSLRWPERCCSCGGAAFSWRKHTEQVVVWTIISVTRYREVSLAIPVCDPCLHRSWRWFGAAAALIGGALLAGWWSGNDAVATWCGLVAFAGILCVLKGVRTKPLNILAFDPDARAIRLKIRHPEVAAALAGGSGGNDAPLEKSMLPMLLGVGALLLGVMVAVTKLVDWLRA